MKIGILYVGTGRYICFWEDFYKTAQQFLFKGHELTYFVYTDAEKICGGSDVVKIHYPKLPWPDAGLMKYDAFLQAKEELVKMDYLFYFNGNMKFVAPIGDEILPKQEDLAICVWPSYFGNQNPDEFPYDRNPKCWANIPFGQGKYYFMAGLHGGKTAPYLQMCEELNAHTKQDVANGQIAVCHDESYINRYMLDLQPLIITPNYAMPEKWKIKGFTDNIKAIVQKKHHYKWGGHAYLRGATDKKLTPIKWWINKVFGTKLI